MMGKYKAKEGYATLWSRYASSDVSDCSYDLMWFLFALLVFNFTLVKEKGAKV